MLPEIILEYLKMSCKGGDKAVSSKGLELRFGISNRRVRKIINKLRCAGEPICSTDNGYFYANSEEELQATISQLQSRIANLSKATKGLKNVKS